MDNTVDHSQRGRSGIEGEAHHERGLLGTHIHNNDIGRDDTLLNIRRTHDASRDLDLNFEIAGRGEDAYESPLEHDSTTLVHTQTTGRDANVSGISAPHQSKLPRPFPRVQAPDQLGGVHSDRGDETFVRAAGHPPGGRGGVGGSPKSPEESSLLISLTNTLDIMSGILKKSIAEGRHDDIINNVNIMFFS